MSNLTEQMRCPREPAPRGFVTHCGDPDWCHHIKTAKISGSGWNTQFRDPAAKYCLYRGWGRVMGRVDHRSPIAARFDRWDSGTHFLSRGPVYSD